MSNTEKYDKYRKEAQDLLNAEILTLPGLLDTRSVYTPEEKVFSVLGYVLTGNSFGAAQISGIDAGTIRKWKQEAPWWKDVFTYCRGVASDRLDAKFTQLLDKVIWELEERLVKGDEKLDKGKVVRLKVPANVLVHMLSNIFDKRQLVRGDVTTRTERVSPDQKLKEVKEFAEQFAKGIKEKQNASSS